MGAAAGMRKHRAVRRDPGAPGSPADTLGGRRQRYRARALRKTKHLAPAWPEIHGEHASARADVVVPAKLDFG